jgi:hypothetical protein
MEPAPHETNKDVFLEQNNNNNNNNFNDNQYYESNNNLNNQNINYGPVFPSQNDVMYSSSNYTDLTYPNNNNLISSPNYVPIHNKEPEILFPQSSHNNNCSHVHLELDFEISGSQTCLCYACCILGIFMIVFAIVAKCKDSDSGSSNYQGGGYNGGLLLWHTHWLCDYGYDQGFVESRMDCHRSYSSLESGCCGLKYPHTYKVKCRDCSQVLKEGYNSGGLGVSILFGMVGIIVGIIALVYLVNKK